MVDTGTSGIALPNDVFARVVDAITSSLKCKGGGGLICEADQLSLLPVIRITLAPDNVLPLFPADYAEEIGESSELLP